jgi:hypothetical protein
MKQADAFMTGPRVPVNGDANVSAYAVDALEYTKRSIAEAMALIILGSVSRIRAYTNITHKFTNSQTHKHLVGW